jgi:hypothetical protein
MFTPGIEGLMSGAIDLDTASIKASLVRGYTFSAANTVVSDVTGATAALSSVSITGGVFDAADTSVSTTANATNHVLIIYQASAVTGGADVAASSQRLIMYMDTGTGLPIQPGTGTVTITWDNGTNRIFKIG